MLEDLGLLNLADFEARAKIVMPNALLEMVAGGFNDEITFKRTQRAFDSIALRPRYLVDVSHVDSSTTVLGRKIDFPVLAGPLGGLELVNPEGSSAACRAAGAAGTAMVVSHAAVSSSIEEVAGVGSGPVWCQVFPLKDRELLREHVRRAEDANCAALCVTVDAPTLEVVKEQSIKNPDPLHPGHSSWATITRRAGGGSRTIVDLAEAIDPDASWDYVDWLRSITSMPVVVKGILTAEDARLCAEHGARGIIVSNHGGRLFDGAITAIEALPGVADAVGGRCEVLMDGGIRRGIDVVKALALGARAVLLGRPVYYGLAAGGESGVKTVFDLLRREMEFSIAMCGKTRLEQLDRSMVVKVSTLYEPGGFASRWNTG